MMKIALAQMDVKLGKPDKNFETIKKMILEAKKSEADLVVFPEMCVGGYLLSDKYTDNNFLRELSLYTEKIANFAYENKISVIWGNISQYADSRIGEDGRKAVFNSAIISKYDKETSTNTLSEISKTLLPNYRIFDDKRYFVPSIKSINYHLEDHIVTINGYKVGIEICEDMWFEDYGINITQKLVEAGADLIINISCSPWTYGKNKTRDRVINESFRHCNRIPFYYCNACGVQNNGKNIVLFDGDSCCYDRHGIKDDIHTLPPYDSGLLYYYVGINNRNVGKTEELEIYQKMQGIIRAYKGLDDMLGFKPNLIFGLSGGIDSAVSCALATIALGQDRIYAYNLPTNYNSEKTKNSYNKIVDNLGLTHATSIFGVSSIYNEIVDLSLKDECTEDHPLMDITKENIQAKIRGTDLLSNLAAIHNGVMVNNGNKLEIALGYATLYGDFDGVFCPLGDLLKTEVFDMARCINLYMQKEIIPKELIPNEHYRFDSDQIVPSAELSKDQVDPMIFGYHDRMLEMVMDYHKSSIEDFAKAYLENRIESYMGLDLSDIPAGISLPTWFIENLEWFFKKLQGSVFKRVQAPPVVLLSKSAFGYDYRESQMPYHESIEYKNLKEEILTKNSHFYMKKMNGWDPSLSDEAINWAIAQTKKGK